MDFLALPLHQGDPTHAPGDLPPFTPASPTSLDIPRYPAAGTRAQAPPCGRACGTRRPPAHLPLPAYLSRSRHQRPACHCPRTLPTCPHPTPHCARALWQARQRFLRAYRFPHHHAATLHCSSRNRTYTNIRRLHPKPACPTYLTAGWRAPHHPHRYGFGRAGLPPSGHWAGWTCCCTHYARAGTARCLRATYSSFLIPAAFMPAVPLNLAGGCGYRTRTFARDPFLPPLPLFYHSSFLPSLCRLCRG